MVSYKVYAATSSILSTCVWGWLLPLASSAALPPPTSSQPPMQSTAPSLGSSHTSLTGNVLPPTPQQTGRKGTEEYIAGFVICLTINIVFVVMVFFALCYLKKVSSRGRDEVDSGQPREAMTWKEALRPVGDKIFNRR